MFKLRWVLRDFKKEVLLGPLFKLIEAIFELLVPFVMAKIIDVGIAGNDSGVILKYGVLIMGFALIGILSSVTCQYFAARCSQGVGTVLRREVYHQINQFSSQEVQQFSSSSLITRLTNDVNQVQLAVAMAIRLAIRAPFLVIGSLIMAFLIDVNMALIFLAAIVLITLALSLLMKLSQKFYLAVQKRLDRISELTQENLEGQRVVRAFNRQGWEIRRFNEAADASNAAGERVGRIGGLFNPLTQIITNLAIVLILYNGAIEVQLGHLSQGNLIALVSYMTQMFLALVVVANLFTIFTKASASARRVNEVLEAACSITDPQAADGRNGSQIGKVHKENWNQAVVRPSETTELNSSGVLVSPPQVKAQLKSGLSVNLEHVSYAYGSGSPALTDLSLRIEPGTMAGIIGGTGCGKSTAVSLIVRLLEAQSGQLDVGGKPIQAWPLAELRSQIRLVPQKAVLFSGTLRENLQWGNPDAGDSQLWAALSVAQAADFVRELPQGLDTPVNQGGRNFSGGQRQRLCIARALAGHPSVLILDDSTSALDFRTEAQLRQALRETKAGMSLIIISQRISSLQSADQILVLDRGKTAGLGTHDQLIQTCTVYQEIVRSQRKGELA